MRESISRYLKRWVWKLWYPLLTRLTGKASLVFLNYGFAADSSDADRPVLNSEDEPNRPCIQLYHRVAAAVDLTGKRLLEVSCGHGGGASYVSRYLRPTSVHGVDRNPRAIELCRRTHSLAGLSFSTGDAMALRFPDGSFDAVLNVEASHCYPDLPRFLAEVRRLLRPGGHFLYADFRDAHPQFAVLQEQVQQSGMEIVQWEDLSPGVVRGMQLNTDRYLALINQLVPGPLRKSAISFAGVKGSPIYQELETGKTVYFRYVLRQPATN